MAAHPDYYAENHAHGFNFLHVCYDQMLTNTRQLLFQGAGYGVVSSYDLQGAIETCTGYQSFDLLILCHSVPQADKQRIIGAFRRKCRAPILALLNEYERIAGAYPVNTSDPAQLLQTISAMLRTKHHIL